MTSHSHSHSAAWGVFVTLLLCSRSQARCPNTNLVFCEGFPPKWRPVDGSCNNANDPTLGMANTPLVRVVEPRYADGVHAPRRGVTARPLPSPRQIVTRLMPDFDVPSPDTNMLVMTWAQLVAHDTSRIRAPFVRANGPCCAFNSPTDSCVQIPVPSNDNFYPRFGISCLSLNRSASAPCQQRHHEQTNQVTHFLDASFVYGSDTTTATNLRTHEGGRLRAREVQGHEFLPVGSTGNTLAGDARALITPMIGALQTVFLREHNRVAANLRAVNPHWRDERLFQESRRVVIAQWQLFCYRDWMQWIVGSDTVRQNLLVPVESGFSRDYSPVVDASTANDFTSGAFRALHSMVANMVWLGGADGFHSSRLLGNVTADSISNPFGLKSVVEGMLYQPRQEQDQFMADELTSKLFRGSSAFGGDLISTDIARGREHGLPGYNDYRARCNMTKARAWEGFRDRISDNNIRILQSLYAHPDDVDFYVGGLLEQRSSRSPIASVTSPTFNCILVDQFRRWKTGDRFFFDLGGPAPGFSEAQLNEIRKQTVARIFCDNIRNFQKIPRDAFLRLDVLGNREVRCGELPFMSFSPWRESVPNDNELLNDIPQDLLPVL